MDYYQYYRTEEPCSEAELHYLLMKMNENTTEYDLGLRMEVYESWAEAFKKC